MTGSVEAQVTAAPVGWLARLASHERRFLAVDGGGGALLLALLPARSPRLRPVLSPRHAELLVVFEPISGKLAPSIVELYRAMPRPCGALVVGTPAPDRFPNAGLRRMEDLLPGVERVPAGLGPSELGHRLLTVPLRSDEAPAEPQINPITVPIPGKKEREIATEPVVLSLGPVQPLTAGPLRLLLTADGEQIVSARIEAGYAARDVARAMSEATVPGAAALASSLDPLAPVAGRLAYVIALEQLQHWGPDPGLRNQREAVLALERAQNHLAWLVRFAELVDDDRLAVTAEQLNAHLADATAPLSERLLTEWVVPQGGVAATQPDKLRAPLDRLIAEVVALRERLEGDRLLALRTAGIGAITVDRLQAVGASGPVLHASERGRGDVLGRLLTRLDQAADDLRQAADFAPVPKPVEGGTADWSAPPGRTEVEIVGPRGHLRLSLMSDSGRLREVNWQRPSAALLNLIPELLAGQKLPCAEVIVASLDLAMAEADG